LQSREPYELIRKGDDYYSLKSHNSLYISPSKGCWNRFSNGQSGRSALDFLISVRGLPFKEAVMSLSGYISPPIGEMEIESSEFILPLRSDNNDRVTQYLQGRCISNEVICFCIDKNILYEDIKHNCVFVGLDGTTPKYCFKRGTGDVTFKGDGKNSDKAFSFQLGILSNELFTCESAIDALSLASLAGESFQKYNYLSLGGTSPKALIQYLKDNPHTKTIHLCLDNDIQGREGVKKILPLLKDYELKIHFPHYKDFNDVLREQNYQREIDSPMLSNCVR